VGLVVMVGLGVGWVACVADEVGEAVEEEAGSMDPSWEAIGVFCVDEQAATMIIQPATIKFAQACLFASTIPPLYIMPDQARVCDIHSFEK
jgi:hypothetical protein